LSNAVHKVGKSQWRYLAKKNLGELRMQ